MIHNVQVSTQWQKESQFLFEQDSVWRPRLIEPFVNKNMDTHSSNYKKNQNTRPNRKGATSKQNPE